MGTPRKPTSPADGWRAIVDHATHTDLLAAALGITGPVTLTPSQVIVAAGYDVHVAIADDGTVLLDAVRADGTTVHPDPLAGLADTGSNGDGEAASGAYADYDDQPAT